MAAEAARLVIAGGSTRGGRATWQRRGAVEGCWSVDSSGTSWPWLRLSLRARNLSPRQRARPSRRPPKRPRRAAMSPWFVASSR